jgi:hypothetical protein
MIRLLSALPACFFALFALLASPAMAYNETCSPVQQMVPVNGSFGKKVAQVPESQIATCKLAQGCVCKGQSCVYINETKKKFTYTTAVNCNTPAGVTLPGQTGANPFPANGCGKVSQDVSFNKSFAGTVCKVYQGCRCTADRCPGSIKNVKCVALPG